MRIVKGSSFATWTKRLQGKSSQSHRRDSTKSRLKGFTKKSRANAVALINNDDNAEALPTPSGEDREERINDTNARVAHEERRLGQSTKVDFVESNGDDEMRDAGPVESPARDKQEVKKKSEETKEVVEETDKDHKKDAELETEEETHDKVGGNVGPELVKDSSWEKISEPSATECNNRELSEKKALTGKIVAEYPGGFFGEDPFGGDTFAEADSVGKGKAQKHDAVIDSRFSSEEDMECSVDPKDKLNHKPVPKEDYDHAQGKPSQQVQGKVPEVLSRSDLGPQNDDDTNEVFAKFQTVNSLVSSKESMKSVSEAEREVVSDNSRYNISEAKETEAVFDGDGGEDEEKTTVAIELQNPYIQAQATATRIMALFEVADDLASEHLNTERAQESYGGDNTSALSDEEVAAVVGDAGREEDGTSSNPMVSHERDGEKEEEAKAEATYNESSQLPEIQANSVDKSLAASMDKDGAKSPIPKGDADKAEEETELNEHISAKEGETKSNKEKSLENTTSKVPESMSQESSDSWDTNGIRHSVSPVRRLLNPKVKTWKKSKRKSKSNGNQSSNGVKLRSNSSKKSLVCVGELITSAARPTSPMQVLSTTPEAILSKLLSESSRLPSHSESEEHLRDPDAETPAVDHDREVSEMVMWSGNRLLGAESFEIVAVKSSSYAKARKEHDEGLETSSAENTTDDEETGGFKKEKKRDKKRKDKVRKGKSKDSTKSKRREKGQEGSKKKHGKRSKRSLARSYSDLSDVVIEHCTWREVVDDGPAAALCNAAIPNEVGDEEDTGCRDITSDITYDLRDMARELAMKGPRVVLKWLE